MNAIQEANFDAIAQRYDAIWSDTPVGRAQRNAVWGHVDPLFKSGDFVLDLGCGTGVDAVHLQSRGISVYGIDSSVRMVEIARRRGVDAHCCPIECLQYFDLRLDGAISNFGALNCLESLGIVARTLGRMVRRGGHLALCFLGPLCLWEISFYLLHGRVNKAFRRPRGVASSSVAPNVFYPSSTEIVSAFRGEFRLFNIFGVGMSVPPSYITFLTHWEVERLSALDRRLANKPIFRSLADHRLYTFERV